MSKIVFLYKGSDTFSLLRLVFHLSTTFIYPANVRCKGKGTLPGRRVVVEQIWTKVIIIAVTPYGWSMLAER